ncbi:MAG: hypothetical protein MUE97_03660 [Phycisphaerales bacterium]|nr:hypothetical protein [Phycisphaerales bacterium]
MHRSPVLLEDLLADLLWPRLLSAWKIALAPGRVIVCFGFVVGVFLLDRLYGLVAHAATEARFGAASGEGIGSPILKVLRTLGGEVSGVLSATVPVGGGALAGPASPERALIGASSLYDLFIAQPLRLTGEHWPLMIFILPIAIAGLCITAGAVCRSVAMQVCLGATLPWREASRFAFGRAVSLIGAAIGPVLGVWLLAAILALVGVTLFTWSLGSFVGAVGFGLMLAAGLGIVVLALGYVLAAPLIIPAFACEGTDAFDAMQRGIGYVLVRPGRLVLYYALAAVMLIIAVGGALLVGFSTLYITQRLTGAPVPSLMDVTDLQRATRTATAITSFWALLGTGVLLAYVLSLIFTLCTIVYLIMRRVVDGQDIGELWVPGGAETSAEIRAADPGLATAVPPPSSPPPAGGASA